jgi:hypothetical protein
LALEYYVRYLSKYDIYGMYKLKEKNKLICVCIILAYKYNEDPIKGRNNTLYKFLAKLFNVNKNTMLAEEFAVFEKLGFFLGTDSYEISVIE